MNSKLLAGKMLSQEFLSLVGSMKLSVSRSKRSVNFPIAAQ
jgi:hypothetical protein